MKKFNNVFINDHRSNEQFCFIIDNEKYYRFNGKYAMYESAMANEKREYAQRVGNTVDQKQVFGLHSGRCPKCQHELSNVPVIRIANAFIAYCETCSTKFTPTKITSLASFIDSEITDACIEYEDIDFTEEVEMPVYELEIEEEE